MKRCRGQGLLLLRKFGIFSAPSYSINIFWGSLQLSASTTGWERRVFNVVSKGEKWHMLPEKPHLPNYQCSFKKTKAQHESPSSKVYNHFVSLLILQECFVSFCSCFSMFLANERAVCSDDWQTGEERPFKKSSLTGSDCSFC